MLLRETLLFLHLVGAAAWIGGMLTMVMAVRPPMVLIELPAQRLRYVTAVMARLFALVAVAIAVIFATGLGIGHLGGGLDLQPRSVQAMVGIASVMVLVFLVINVGPYARLRRWVAAGQWTAAVKALSAIRLLLALNLVLGLLVFAVATIGRAL